MPASYCEIPSGTYFFPWIAAAFVLLFGLPSMAAQGGANRNAKLVVEGDVTCMTRKTLSIIALRFSNA